MFAVALSLTLELLFLNYHQIVSWSFRSVLFLDKVAVRVLGCSSSVLLFCILQEPSASRGVVHHPIRVFTSPLCVDTFCQQFFWACRSMVLD